MAAAADLAALDAPDASADWSRRDGLWIDPRTKLLLLGVTNAAVLSGWSPAGMAWLRTALMVLPLVLLVTARRPGLALAFAAILAACHLAAVLLVPMAGPAAALGALGAMLLRVLPVAALGCYVIVSTQVSEFIAAMERLRLPRALVIPMAVVLRFLPTVAHENRAIADAMRMRGIGGAGTSPVALLEYRMVPLLVSLTKIADELSAASLTRGLGGPVRRTNVCRIGPGIADGVLVLAMLGVLVAAVLT